MSELRHLRQDDLELGLTLPQKKKKVVVGRIWSKNKINKMAVGYDKTRLEAS